MDALTLLVAFVVSSARPVTLAQCAAQFPRRKVGNIRKQLAQAARQGRIVSSAIYDVTVDSRVVSCGPEYKTTAFRAALVLGNAFLSLRPELEDAVKAVASEYGPTKTVALLSVLMACARNAQLSFGYVDQHGNASHREVTEVGQVFRAQDGFCMWGYGTKETSDGAQHDPAPRCFRVDRMTDIRIINMQAAPTGLAYPLVHTFGSKPVTKEVWAQHPEGYVESGAILF